jgi:hypothetical protein
VFPLLVSQTFAKHADRLGVEAAPADGSAGAPTTGGADGAGAPAPAPAAAPAPALTAPTTSAAATDAAGAAPARLL